MRKLLFLIPVVAVAITGCNNDDVIEPDDPSAKTGFRPITQTSSAYQNKVYEYLPGPGQFINETVTGGFAGDETTMQAAISYAENRLGKKKFVSLGSFGGYIVVGFDHSISNSKEEYDFAILGNAMDSSNEPGIVWVMQDTNQNGLPDDVWYELRGSETGEKETIQNYSVTYFRPAEPNKPVEWIDSEGNSGTVDYLKAYHKQDYYYPAWVTAESYTLTGTKLEARNSQDPQTGYWTNASYPWGYADNIGSDALSGNEQWVGFRIANAMDSDGIAVTLDYIDFVKVQQGVLAKSGWLGENSCEVVSIADYSMLFK